MNEGGGSTDGSWCLFSSSRGGSIAACGATRTIGSGPALAESRSGTESPVIATDGGNSPAGRIAQFVMSKAMGLQTQSAYRSRC